MPPAWLPLESNPEILNKYSWQLGLSETFAFHDVYGLDPDLLGMARLAMLSMLASTQISWQGYFAKF
jgi:ubiquitin carboxyl-terminal hydrolase L3